MNGWFVRSTMIMGAVIGLTFLFGFGNVLALALLLGVPTWVAPLLAGEFGKAAFDASARCC